MTDVTIPAGQWCGDAPAGDLTMQPTGVMAGTRPGWLTVTGWRACRAGELAREPITVEVRADALPEYLRPDTGGAW